MDSKESVMDKNVQDVVIEEDIEITVGFRIPEKMSSQLITVLHELILI